MFLMGALLVGPLWAGKDLPDGPGDTVVPDEVLVRLNPGVVAAAVLAKLLPNAQFSVLHPGLNLVRIKLPAKVTATIRSLVAADPNVVFVESNRVRQIAIAPPDDSSYAAQQWNLTAVHAVQAWALSPGVYLTSATATASRVKIAVIDTGADCTHPDFINAGGSSTSSASGGQLNWALSQAVLPTTIASPACPWLDDHGHGTHMAGIVAAATNNGQGVAGLGYSLQVVVMRAMSAPGTGTDADIARAITAATDAGAFAISMSFGGVGYSQAVQTALNYAWSHNVMLVAAAGNDSADELFFPASGNHVIGVAATDNTGARASFSNFGKPVSIAAPGSNVYSTVPTYTGTTLFNTFGYQNYTWLSGTSASTPHIAATAGLLASTTPALSAAAAARRIQQTAASGAAGGGWDLNLGYGLLDAMKALSGPSRASSLGGIVGQVVNSSNLPVAGATVAAGGQSFLTDASGLFRLRNLAAGKVQVAVTGTGFTALSIPATVPAGADANLTVVTGAALGTITGNVSINTAPVAGVTVEALSAGLIQASTLTASDGSYSLSLPAGTYDVRASDIGVVTTTAASKIVRAGRSITVNIAARRMGTISGTVKDSSGQPIPNAQLTISGPTSAGATTDAAGSYTSIGLPAGSYTVTATAANLPPASATGVVVTNDSSASANLTLSGGGSVNSAPVAVSVTPSSGSGTSQTFTFVYTDANGAADISTAYALLNSGLDANNACYIVLGSGNQLYLVSDTGALLGPVAPGANSTLQNSQCSLNAASVTVSASGTNLTLSVPLTFQPGFAGTRQIFMNVVDNAGAASGWVAKGTWAPATNAAPAAVSVTPAAGSGSSQTFSFAYSDANGATDLSTVYALINGALDANSACYVFYSRAANALFLVGDTGGTTLGPLTPGSAATLQNNQCTLNGSGSSAALAGTGLTLNLSLTFKPAFTGTKSVFMYAVDAAGANSGWQNTGTWTPAAAAAPVAVSVTPSSGTAATQTFALLYSDATGATALSRVYALINSGLDSNNACYFFYDSFANAMYLVSDTGGALSAPITPGNAGSAQNSQCTLTGTGSSVISSGSNLTVNAAVTFNSAFVGPKTIYMNASDSSGVFSGWSAKGTWTLGANAPPTNVSVTPATGSGLTAALSLVYSDPNGASDLNTVYALVNGALDSTNACYVLYDRRGNALFLVSDDGSALLGPLTPGSPASVQNTQCTVSVPTAGSAAGTTLTLPVSITFSATFTGPKTVYMNASDASGVFAGWEAKGAWTP